ncbi:MAG: hypothetical protein GIW95_04880 [Candidatus Eremiobacteraeota bacterium]|nr:hypothetical protein [Candidatus Eremiobacteraeota bacterium]
MRRRIADTRRVAAGSCKRCAAPLESGTLCAPCDGERTAVRRRALESVLFNAPWLESAEIVALVEGVTRSDIEIARKALLIRWWVVLDRARRSTRPLGVRERQVASSYVLLQSGLPPDRITPEIVRNLLGDDLEARLARVE